MIDIDIRKLTLPNGRTIEQQMQHEAKRFVKILQEEIDDWYDNYNPSMYSRSYAMSHCIYAENMVDININSSTLEIKIKYTDAAYHESLWGGEVDTLLLMNEGYKVSKGWHKDIPYFGYRDGGHFLESAVERYNNDNDLGINIQIDY